MKTLLFIVFIVSLTTHSFGQVESEYVQKHFLIAASTKNYSEALKKAKYISKELNLKLDLRDLITYKNNQGLTLEKPLCDEGRVDFPCYIERGNRDDGNYVSVEWSNSYQPFTPGYYLVVPSSQSDKNNELLTLLKKIKKFVPDAYIKSAWVFNGCTL